MARKKTKDPPDKCLGVDCNVPQPHYRTIKTSLKSILKDETMLEPLNELVKKCHNIVSDAYMFIRLYALTKYHAKQPIPELTADFIRYCIIAMGTRDARGRSVGDTALLEELNNFYEKEYQPIHAHQKHSLVGLSYSIPYLCQTMETCLSTNLKEHFCKRLIRFINLNGGLYYDTHYDNATEKKQVLWALKKAILIQKEDDIPVQMREWYNMHKNSMLPTNIEKSVPYDCQKSPFKYIAPSFYMNELFEDYNNKLTEENRFEAIRLFQPLSLRNSSIPKYITIDTASLINLFADKGTKGKLLQSLKENQEVVWDHHFRMKKRIFRKQTNYTFNYTMQTDGVGCSLLFVRNDYKEKKYGIRIETYEESIPYIDDISEYQLEILKQKKIITADPGRKYLMYMMDDEGNSLKYSCMARDTESLAKRNRRILMTNKKNNSIVGKEAELSNHCCKTISIEKFKAFIKCKYETNQLTSVFYEQELYRKMNWRKKVYRQKSEDKFLNNIENVFGAKEDIVVCIGDWSNKNTIKGLAPSMGVGLKKIIRKRYTTLLLDEYNTSKKCSHCWNDVCNVSINGTAKHRLLSCNSCAIKNTGSPEDEQNAVGLKAHYLTRDKNSCINMLNIVKHMLYRKRERPAVFCRSKNILPSPSG